MVGRRAVEVGQERLLEACSEEQIGGCVDVGFGVDAAQVAFGTEVVGEGLVHLVRAGAELPHPVAVLSPPALGEDLDSPANSLAGGFAAITREVASAEGATYLPLFERTVDTLRQKGTRPGAAYRSGAVYAERAAMRHVVLRQSFDAISRSRRLLLTTDTVHLNSQGAAIVAELTEAFARGDRRSATVALP